MLVSDTIPINIGFIGAYAKKIFGDDIEISLFKYPRSVLEAIDSAPPDVIALSNYSWNSKLSERIARFAKERNPTVVTVQGGTNFPHREKQQLEFLLTRPATDIFIVLEGEVAFAELLRRVLETRDGNQRLLDKAIPGCVHIAQESRHTEAPVLVKGALPARLRELDDIPSPYLNGMLEQFFDGRLTPFLETNRGCPFKCTFCHTGADYFQKISMFSLERLKEEIAYIAPRASSLGIVNLHLADTNFGMFSRDREICEALLKSQQQYGWPHQIMSTTGKNNKERVIEITKMMGNVFSVNMSVQTMDHDVLVNIKRDNIQIDSYTQINQSLNEQGRSTKGELIIGLPGETKGSFVHGLEQVIAAGVSSVCSYSLMLLHGTEFKDPDYREKFTIQGKYRIVPLNFGEYAGERVFDVEEVAYATSTMSFEDYLWIRGLCLFVEVMHNNRPFDELIRYGIEEFGMTRFQLLKRAYESLGAAPAPVREIVEHFMDETRAELWDSEHELEETYSRDENYARLSNGEAGSNLIYKYKAASLAFCNKEWADYLGTTLNDIALEQTSTDEGCLESRRAIEALVGYVKAKLAGVLDADGNLDPTIVESPYDIAAWLNNGGRLLDQALPSPLAYIFEYTDDQLAARKDYFRRYGSDANALSKIVTRVSNVESLFRRRRTLERSDTPEPEEARRDLFIRYTLSG
ncbi:MAG: radical SAM protein [Sulfuritalea sp.]|nr:radical SAM protein [Sulfuritalea sp.]